MSLQHVTGINHFLRTGRVIRPRVGATNRFVFTGEFLCISLPPRQDLSPQDVVQYQIILNVCMLLIAAINHVAETKISKNNFPELTKQFVKVSPRRVATTCQLECSHLEWHMKLTVFFNKDTITLRRILCSSLKFIRLLRVVFSSQQRLNRPAVNTVQ